MDLILIIDQDIIQAVFFYVIQKIRVVFQQVFCGAPTVIQAVFYDVCVSFYGGKMIFI